MEDNTNIVTILFERKILRTIEDTTVYYYLPLEVLRGIEQKFDDNRIFSCPAKSVVSLKDLNNECYNEQTEEYEFNFIDDICSLDEQYVYGFPLIINNQPSKEIRKITDYVQANMDLLAKSNLHHVFIEPDGILNLFVKVNDIFINVKADDFYELQGILFGSYDRYSQVIDELLKQNKERVSTPSYNITIPKQILFANEIYDRVSKTVICQDDQIKSIASAIAKNSRLEKPALKSNLLVCGSTGVGKSEIFRSISSNFNIPISFEDSNEYTANSYKGKDVTDMLVHLYENANYDLEKAQRGILIIDEIDKKASVGNEHETFKSAVINSLLKMMEGHTYSLEMDGGNVDFDTSLLTFAFLGAFSGIGQGDIKKKVPGFITKEEETKQKDPHTKYSNDNLKQYGLLPEFIGRCDTIVTLNDLTTEDFIKIINFSDKSQLLLYKELFESMQIKFLYDEQTIEAIAKKATDLGLGARSIKKIVENALFVANYEIFSVNNYSELIITPETIENNKVYSLR